MSADDTKQAAARRRAGSAGEKSPSKLDFQLIAAIITMLLLGLFMVFSASFPSTGTTIFLKQVRLVALGVAACIVVTVIPYTWWQKLALPVMLVTLFGLAAVLVVGVARHGGIRHLSNGSGQPSEIAKIGLAIYVAAWAAVRGKKLATLSDGLAPFLFILGAVASLIALERSFSVTIIILVIGLTVYFVAGGNVKQISGALLIGAPLLLLTMMLVGYPFSRIEGWYNIWFNPSQAHEETLRIAMMLRAGRGIGVDPAMWHLKAAVPALYTDYLFANIAADLHLFGTLLVLALYIWFGYRAMTIALNASTLFGTYLASGLGAWILVQAAIHIGTSLALIPATGQPLPFMSAGGSSLLACMIAAGLLLSISRESTEKTSAYATFGVGWRDWWARVSRPVRGERAAQPVSAVRRPVRRRPRPAGSRTMASSIPRLDERTRQERRR